MSALPSKAPSNFVASISPPVLNLTLSAPSTLNMIWLSVLNLIWSVASLPITKPVFKTDVIVVCAAVIATSLAFAVIPFPPITFRVGLNLMLHYLHHLK